MLPPLRRALLLTAAMSAVAFAAPAQASVQDDIAQLKASLAAQEKLIDQQRRALQHQQAKLEAQAREIGAHRRKLEALGPLTAEAMATERGAGTQISRNNAQRPPSAAPVSTAQNEAYSRNKQGNRPQLAATAPEEKVQASFARQEEETARPEINALPDTGGVLTPKGVLMYENSTDYTNTSSNVFTFQGVQVAEVVLVGVINATSSRRQVLQNSSRVRLGLTNRLETDIRVPYAYRNDATTTSSGGSTTKNVIEGHGFGDIDMGLSYQINSGRDDWPFLIGNLRYKHDNADGPFDVPYNSSNIATRLPTGSGFKSLEASVTAIKVTDPAVLFANLGYVFNLCEDINKTFGTTRITSVDPGDAINASVGLGFSINPETSFTLGYKHSHVFNTMQHSVDTGTLAKSSARTDSLEVGAMTFGISHRFNPITSVSLNMEVGATEDAPDVRVGVRVPVRLGKVFD
ncbi:MAG: hypothetical protein GC131_07705 [Alphaproteobacteria bacterium]|nr:hypothetical protein [Alphaproteobacteria bacterium]